MTPSKLFLLITVASLTSVAPVRGDTILAVGTDWGQPKGDGYESRAIVYRSNGASWQEANLPTTASGYLRGVVYSASNTAWAFGASADDAPMLLKSADDGVSWIDASNTLPTSDFGTVRPIGMVFIGDSEGWLLGLGHGSSGPFLSHTSDGGKSWSPYEAHNAALAGVFRLGATRSAAYLLRSDNTGSTLEELGDPAHSRSLGTAGSYMANALAMTDAAVWVVGTRVHDVTDATASLGREPAVDTIANRDFQLTKRDPIALSDGELHTVSFLSSDLGATGGRALSSTGTAQPLILTTSDAGSSWQHASLLDPTPGMAVEALLLRPTAGYALANADRAPGTALLTTGDAGHSWSRVVTRIDASGRFMGLAANPAKQ